MRVGSELCQCFFKIRCGHFSKKCQFLPRDVPFQLKGVLDDDMCDSGCSAFQFLEISWSTTNMYVLYFHFVILVICFYF